jgi:hypothetical protein
MVYTRLLEKIQSNCEEPQQLYDYWPIQQESSFFSHYFQKKFVTMITENDIKLFWSSMSNSWGSYKKVTMADPNLESSDSIYPTLSNLGFHFVFPPDDIVQFLASHTQAIPILSKNLLIEFLHESNGRKSTKTADEILYYLLYDLHLFSEKHVTSVINSMNSLKILPLDGGQVGTFRTQHNNSNSSELYLLSEFQEDRDLLGSSEKFIDRNSKSFSLLRHSTVAATNVRKFTPGVMQKFLHVILPSAWKHVSCIYISGVLLKDTRIIDLSPTKTTKKSKSKLPASLSVARDTSVNVSQIQTKLSRKSLVLFCFSNLEKLSFN